RMVRAINSRWCTPSTAPRRPSETAMCILGFAVATSRASALAPAATRISSHPCHRGTTRSTSRCHMATTLRGKRTRLTEVQAFEGGRLRPAGWRGLGGTAGATWHAGSYPARGVGGRRARRGAPGGGTRWSGITVYRAGSTRDTPPPPLIADNKYYVK